MANIHLLTYGGGTYQLVLHVAVPVGNNSAGVPWNTALLNSHQGGTSTLTAGTGTAGTIAAAELAAIQAGNTLEVVYAFSPSADFEALSAAAQKTAIDGVYGQITGQRLTELGQLLKWFGLTLV